MSESATTTVTNQPEVDKEQRRSTFEIVWELKFIQADKEKEYPHGWGFTPPLVKFPEDADTAWIGEQCRELYSNDEFICINAIPKKVHTWLSTIDYPREA